MKDYSDYYLKEEDTVSKPVIYQALPRLFGNCKTANIPYGTVNENGVGKFSDFTGAALDSIRSLGITYVWYTGVIEHAGLSDYRKYGIPLDDADVVKGRAGSPYAIRDYYDVDPDLAIDVPDRMKEFEELIDRTHRHGLKVLIDFIPNHVARKYHSDMRPAEVSDLGEGDDTTKSFSPGNNFYYLPGKKFMVPKGYQPLGDLPFPTKDGKFNEVPAKATGNNVFKARPDVNDWFETVKLNYGVDMQHGGKEYFDPIPSTWFKMRDILLFWAAKGVDGFRCDIAEMVPVAFWHWVIPLVKSYNTNLLFIAEIYNPSGYRDFINTAGFDYLYDKVQLYDTLRNIVEGKGKTAGITTVWRALRGMNGRMLRFLENHDEQRIASPFFAGDPFRALPAMTVTATIYKGPVMIYCGQEVGERGEGVSGFSRNDGRTTIFDYWSMPEFRKWVDGHKYDGAKLDVSQKKIRNFYRSLLTLAGTEEALKRGEFFDLTAWNDDRGTGDPPPEDVYMFLRITENQTLLVAVNFNMAESYDFAFTVPATIDNVPVFHGTKAETGRQNLLGKTGVLIIEKGNNPLTGKIKIDKGGSVIFNL